MKKNEFLKQYYAFATMQMHCTNSGNYEKGNVASTKLLKLNKFLVDHYTEYLDIVDMLLESDNPNVVIWVTNVSAELHYRTSFAIERLSTIAAENQSSLISLDAAMMLKELFNKKS